jgi:GNAT superfamily N-acetyltransferase
MTSDIRYRRATAADMDRCADICFTAFGGINARHGFPPEMPTREIAGGLIAMCMTSPVVYGVVAEQARRIVGSNFLWETGTIAGIGPISVDPAVQAKSIGRGLMQSVLDRARERGFAGVRLVQAAFNSQSMSLYTKLGFDIREPLVCMNGEPVGKPVDGYTVRQATEADLDACVDVCRRVHGHDRRGDLAPMVAQGAATVVLRGGEVVGYASDVGFFGHCVALDNPGLIALIAAAPRFSGPGFLLPSRIGEVFRWCLENGLRVIQPMSLMTLGLYNEPRGAFIPSILF